MHQVRPTCYRRLASSQNTGGVQQTPVAGVVLPVDTRRIFKLLRNTVSVAALVAVVQYIMLETVEVSTSYSRVQCGSIDIVAAYRFTKKNERPSMILNYNRLRARLK